MPTTPIEFVAKAEDLNNLLDHIAWTDLVQPALDREKTRLGQALTNTVLGMPVEHYSLSGKCSVFTPEQLAGMVYGIDFIQRLFKKILKNGTTALTSLEEGGLKVTFS